MGVEKAICAIAIVGVLVLVMLPGCVKLDKIVPSQIDGWHIEGGVSSLSPDSLPDKELAELLCEYNVLRVYTATYTKSTSTLTAVVYKMKNSSYSAGLFSIMKGELQDKGEFKVRLGDGVVSFYKGRFVVILEGEDVEINELVDLAGKIASSLPQGVENADSQKGSIGDAKQLKIFFGEQGFSYACPEFPKPERMGKIEGKVYVFQDGVGFLIKSEDARRLYRRWVRMIGYGNGEIPPSKGFYLAVRAQEGLIAGAYLAEGGDGEVLIGRLFEESEEKDENGQTRVLSLARWGNASTYSVRNGLPQR